MLPNVLVTSLIQTGLNNLISKSSQAQRSLLRLHNKTLSLHLSDINKTLVFVFDKEVKVLTSYDGKLDCIVSLPLSIAPKLKDKSQLTTLLKQDKLTLTGDIDTLQQFLALLEELNFDIAEWLSAYTGDVVAHSLTSGIKSVFSSMKALNERQQHYISEVIIEEWRFAPSALEVASFADTVDEVNRQLSHFESRLQVLENALKCKSE